MKRGKFVLKLLSQLLLCPVVSLVHFHGFLKFFNRLHELVPTHFLRFGQDLTHTGNGNCQAQSQQFALFC